MKHLRKLFCILFIIILTSFMGTASFAHSGRLDSNGGHWDRSNNTYHYHDGTNTSGSSSSKAPNTNKTASNDKKVSNVLAIVAVSAVVIIVFAIIIHNRS